MEKIKEYWIDSLDFKDKEIALKNYGKERSKRLYLADEVDKVLAEEIAKGIALATAELFKFKKAYAEAVKEAEKIRDRLAWDPNEKNWIDSTVNIFKKHLGKPADSDLVGAPGGEHHGGKTPEREKSKSDVEGTEVNIKGIRAELAKEFAEDLFNKKLKEER